MLNVAKKLVFFKFNKLVRGLASFNGKYQKVISMDETYLGMIFRAMGSCEKNFSSLGVVVTLSAEAYFFGGFT